MPTVGERIATLEVLASQNARRLIELHDDIHGGATVEYEQSIRGRLHKMQNAIEAADKLADATRELVREQSRLRQSRVKTWQWVTGMVIAAIAVANPYVVLLLR